MKTLIKLIEECVNTPNKIRGRMCIFCVIVFVVGLIYTANNIISKPINFEGKMERAK